MHAFFSFYGREHVDSIPGWPGIWMAWDIYIYYIYICCSLPGPPPSPPNGYGYTGAMFSAPPLWVGGGVSSSSSSIRNAANSLQIEGKGGATWRPIPFRGGDFAAGRRDHIYIYKYIYIHTHTRTRTCIHKCMHTCMHTANIKSRHVTLCYVTSHHITSHHIPYTPWCMPTIKDIRTPNLENFGFASGLWVFCRGTYA